MGPLTSVSSGGVVVQAPDIKNPGVIGSSSRSSGLSDKTSNRILFSA